jgi:hypothetical protein
MNSPTANFHWRFLLRKKRGDEKDQKLRFNNNVWIYDNGDTRFARCSDIVQARLYLPDSREHNKQWRRECLYFWKLGGKHMGSERPVGQRRRGYNGKR